MDYFQENSPEEKTNYTKALFESIKRTNDYGQEYWSARDLRKTLEYTEYSKFLPVIKKAMDACQSSGGSVSDHFAEVSEMVQIGSGAERKLDNFHLSRYACYLIVQTRRTRPR